MLKVNWCLSTTDTFTLSVIKRTIEVYGCALKENVKLSRVHNNAARPHTIILQWAQSSTDARRYTKVAGAKL
ncbi:hypothetical protein NQ314_005828 [Rhamnusium bicolor]|uniref:Uncharacterized protein n=1 Tax=Rhamnusium bicolor TaxID=1586634 RepID=A0AAV8ZDN3_9CUCU|nr:hypothetical protein NQ314_005828 [Rhamnusium bicolor]